MREFRRIAIIIRLITITCLIIVLLNRNHFSQRPASSTQLTKWIMKDRNRTKYAIQIRVFVTMTYVSSSLPSAAYMRQSTLSSLVQVMAFRMFGAKPLPEPMLAYCQLDSWEHISVKYESVFYHFHSRICNWKCRLPEWRPIFQWNMG